MIHIKTIWGALKGGAGAGIHYHRLIVVFCIDSNVKYVYSLFKARLTIKANTYVSQIQLSYRELQKNTSKTKK